MIGTILTNPMPSPSCDFRPYNSYTGFCEINPDYDPLVGIQTDTGQEPSTTTEVGEDGMDELESVDIYLNMSCH